VGRWFLHCRLLELRRQAVEKNGGAPAPENTPASLMREMLCRLGPAFIKIGQALSR